MRGPSLPCPRVRHASTRMSIAADPAEGFLLPQTGGLRTTVKVSDGERPWPSHHRHVLLEIADRLLLHVVLGLVEV
jgi:hypothetical protein